MNEYIDLGIRLTSAMFAGMVIGYTREKLNRPAGLRTHSLITLGSALITILSANIFGNIYGGDPGRVTAQIVSGIGFLGAGTIIKTGFSVKGLTTAATMWVSAAIGIAFGIGEYFLGILATILSIVIITLLRQIETFISKKEFKKCIILADNSIDFMKKINKWIDTMDISINKLECQKEDNQMRVVIEFSNDNDYEKAKTDVSKLSKQEEFKGINFL
jgi:putative Mg2+ transporter-C (MgtC) family protein